MGPPGWRRLRRPFGGLPRGSPGAQRSPGGGQWGACIVVDTRHWTEILASLPRKQPRLEKPISVRRAVSFGAWKDFARETPADAEHRLPHVPAGHRGPGRPRATARARERARTLVYSFCRDWIELETLWRELAAAEPRQCDRRGVFRHPIPPGARGPLCSGYPGCRYCRFYMLARSLGSAGRVYSDPAGRSYTGDSPHVAKGNDRGPDC